MLIAGGVDNGVPCDGSRYSGVLAPADPVKSNMFMMLPAVASNEPPPRRSPPSQLSSMKRTTEAWLAIVSDTKFDLAHGEITSSGIRVPGPQRPLTGMPATPIGRVGATTHTPPPFHFSTPPAIQEQ